MSEIIIPEHSTIYSICQKLVKDAKVIILTGLPGVGKSLYVQQLALMAQQSGRQVHLLQWDVARDAFETDAILAKYPEIDGVTHAMIRKAIGLWARSSIMDWAEQFSGDDHLLIGEAPFVGERLMQLAKVYDDSAETLLASDKAQFLLPVPTNHVRALIEKKRASSIANPQHEHESKDAPPNVLTMMWHEIHDIGATLGFCEPSPSPAYDAEVYQKMYEYLSQYRNSQTLIIDEVLQPSGSVYDLSNIVGHLQAPPDEVDKIIAHLERDSTVEAIEAEVSRWYQF